MTQINMIREELVDHRQWITKEKFNRVLAVYQALPGPEAMELCCYFGFVSRGRVGSVIAGLGFLLPGFIFMIILISIYVNTNPLSIPAVGAAFAAMICRATHRISESAIENVWGIIIAIGAAAHAAVHVNFFVSFFHFWTDLSCCSKSHIFGLCHISLVF
jgi:chromate transporter